MAWKKGAKFSEIHPQALASRNIKSALYKKTLHVKGNFLSNLH